MGMDLIIYSSLYSFYMKYVLVRIREVFISLRLKAGL